jgi:hypothetical protein
MQLKEVQQLLSQTSQGPASATEALRQLRACVEKALEYLALGNTPQTQLFLEQGFTNLVRAFYFLNLDLEQVVQREHSRQDASMPDRVILIFSDHAELRVDGELRGTFPMYSSEDYQELRQIAQLFQCRMEHSDHLQLGLFSVLEAKRSAS